MLVSKYSLPIILRPVISSDKVNNCAPGKPANP